LIVDETQIFRVVPLNEAFSADLFNIEHALITAWCVGVPTIKVLEFVSPWTNIAS